MVFVFHFRIDLGIEILQCKHDKSNNCKEQRTKVLNQYHVFLTGNGQCFSIEMLLFVDELKYFGNCLHIENSG